MRRTGMQRGFTLVETAVVLVVISLILSAIIPLIVSQQLNAAVAGTRAKEDAIKQAMIGFVARNGRLPCPAGGPVASPAPPPPAPQYGQEVFPCNVPAAVPPLFALLDAGGNPAMVRGIVPWVSLGLPDDAALDAWGHRFSYQVQAVATTPAVPPAPMPLQLAAQGDVMQINIAATAGGVPTNNQPTVAVVMSHGPDGFGAFLPITGVRRPLPPIPPIGNLDEMQNATNNPPPLQLVQRPYSNGANPFDDILMALSVDDLVGPLVNSQAVEPVQKSVRDGLGLLMSAVEAAVLNLPAGPCGGGPPAPATCGQRLPVPVAPLVPGAACPPGFLPGDACTTGTIQVATAGATVTTSAQQFIPPIPAAVPATILDPWGTAIRFSILTFPAGAGAAGAWNANVVNAAMLQVRGTLPMVQLWSAGPNKLFPAGANPEPDDIVLTLSAPDFYKYLNSRGAQGGFPGP